MMTKISSDKKSTKSHHLNRSHPKDVLSLFTMYLLRYRHVISIHGNDKICNCKSTHARMGVAKQKEPNLSNQQLPPLSITISLQNDGMP